MDNPLTPWPTSKEYNEVSTFFLVRHQERYEKNHNVVVHLKTCFKTKKEYIWKSHRFPL
jgi:hypothetical protein